MRNASSGALRVAAIADIHCTRGSANHLAPLFAEMAAQADVLALCGDLTDYGLAEEAEVLAGELRAAHHATILAVLGNHDFESDQAEAIKARLSGAGVRVLDGESCEIKGVGFAGAKGFMGGFGSRMLQSWGEKAIKAAVRESIDEALKLETALSRLETATRVALLHYSPIRGTVVGEPEEIFPYLGCTRLEEACDRFPVAAVFHGHAHHGSPRGATSRGAAVFNVAVPVLRRVRPDKPPFILWEAPTHEQEPQERTRPVLHARPRRA